MQDHAVAQSNQDIPFFVVGHPVVETLNGECITECFGRLVKRHPVISKV
jgi:hypothetical protein